MKNITNIRLRSNRSNRKNQSVNKGELLIDSKASPVGVVGFYDLEEKSRDR